MPVRLPQDVLISGDAAPEVRTGGGLDELASRHLAALERGAHDDRANALWGLVAHGDRAVRWCTEALRSDDEDVVEDAAGVAAWIDAPGELVALMLERLAALPDGQARDAIVLALPAEARARLGAEDGDRADGDVPFPSHPEMTEVWYVEAAYDDVCAFYRPWQAGIDARTRFSEHRGSLDELLGLLEPPVRPSWKTLLVDTASNWTAIFSQSGDGADWAAHVAVELRTRAVRTSFSAHTTDAAGNVTQYGDVALWLFDGRRDDVPLHEVRTIQATRDDSGWSCYLSGEPQPSRTPHAMAPGASATASTASSSTTTAGRSASGARIPRTTGRALCSARTAGT